MKATFILSILLSLLTSVYAQIDTEHYVDVSGRIITNDLEDFDYNPDYGLKKTIAGPEFEEGYYYDENNLKVEGTFKFSNTKIFFKPKGDTKKSKLSTKNIKGFVVGVDSFYRTKNFSTYTSSGMSVPLPVGFVKHLTTFDGHSYAVHYSNFIPTYLVKNHTTNMWISFPKRKKLFIRQALVFFGDNPFLREKLESGELTEQSIFGMIKLKEYEYKWKNNIPIHYDRYWNEMEKEGDYKAIIKEKRDSIFTLDYYRETKKIASAHLTSFFPSRFVDTLTYFSDDGTVRKIVDFSDSEQPVISTFYANGNKHYVLFPTETDLEYSNMNAATRTVYQYEQVYSPSSQSIDSEIIKSGNSTIHHEFKDDFINQSYEVADGEQLHHAIYSSKVSNLKIEKLQGMLSLHSFNHLKNAFASRVRGKLLVQIKVNEKGFAQNITLVNHLHEEVDEELAKFFDKTLINVQNTRLKLKKYKVNKIPVKYILTIPITINTNRFYSNPTNYHFNHFNYHLDHFMIHQNMWLNQPPINLPTPPSFPSRF